MSHDISTIKHPSLPLPRLRIFGAWHLSALENRRETQRREVRAGVAVGRGGEYVFPDRFPSFSIISSIISSIIFHHFFHHFPYVFPESSSLSQHEAVSGFALPQVQVRQQRAMSDAANHAQLAPGAPRAPNQTFGGFSMV